MKKCLQCHKEFEPINPKGKFCSDKCRVTWHRKRGGLKTVGHDDNGEPVQMYIPTVDPEKTPPQKMTWNEPITLERLKDLCPKELKGIDRTIWISEAKKEHGL